MTFWKQAAELAAEVLRDPDDLVAQHDYAFELMDKAREIQKEARLWREPDRP